MKKKNELFKRIAQFADEKESFYLSDVMEEFDLSIDEAKEYLEKLKEVGEIRETGETQKIFDELDRKFLTDFLIGGETFYVIRKEDYEKLKENGK